GCWARIGTPGFLSASPRATNAVSLLAGGATQRSLFDVANADTKTLDRYGPQQVRLVDALGGPGGRSRGAPGTGQLGQDLYLGLTPGKLSHPEGSAVASHGPRVIRLAGRSEGQGPLARHVDRYGERSRTPRINTAKPAPGRDHWGAVQSV